MNRRPDRATPPPPAAPFVFAGVAVPPGRRAEVEVPVARLATQTRIGLPVALLNGAHAGPTVWLSAAIHGDELNGMAIIGRVLERLDPKRLRGRVIAVPVVNVFGFIQQQRYLPDGRDLNRSFPGSARGSLASRLANLFMREVVARSDFGIDLHTAGGHRTNLPQVRANLDDPASRAMAEAFGAPIMIHGDSPGGSLRDAVARTATPIIVYEAGEPHRFNSDAINLGVKGVLAVLASVGVTRRRPTQRTPTTIETRRRTWVRARAGGIARLRPRLGQWVSKGESLGSIGDVFGAEQVGVVAPADGLVIGLTNHPIVNQGDALVHLATDVQTGGVV